MRGDADTGRDRADADAVRVTPVPPVRGRIWLLVAALGLAALVLLSAVRPLLQRPAEPPPPQLARPAPAANPAQRPSSREAVAVAPMVRLQRLPAPPVGEDPAAESGAGGTGDVGAAADAAIEDADSDAEENGDTPRGIALFPPPGTDPPKRGIVVPDDFPLPPGYVRHYQVTDDGKPLAAILMFHPDYQLVDERGEPIAMPDDRVVPPDMAPPGLAIEMLEVPDTQIPMMEVPEEQSAQDPPS